MNATVQQQSYSTHSVLSIHRTEMHNVSALEFMHIYVRFQLGRETSQDRDWFVWGGAKMTPEAFHDKNNFNIVEPVYEVVQS